MQFSGNIALDDDISRDRLIEEFRALAELRAADKDDKVRLANDLEEYKFQHARFIEMVAEEFHREADSHSLCGAYDTAVERINERLTYEGFDTIPPREKEQEVEVLISGNLSVRHTIRVKARDLDAAKEIVRKANHSGEISDLLDADDEFPHSSVDQTLTAAAADEFFADTTITVVSG